MSNRLTGMNRRTFIKSTALISGALASSSVLTGCVPVSFRHGVASGDPLQDRVILWTRVTPKGQGVVPVKWQVARDASFRKIVAEGLCMTDASRDYTVKADATGLQPNTRYFYQFIAPGSVSPIGRTKTLPEGDVSSFKVGVFSCANYPAGYFNVYKEAAKRHDLDAVLHLGDYIYEYGLGGYATEDAIAMGRVPEPTNEILSLQDYRLRYAQYHTDPNLQELHANFPFIAVWDDHETANDAWREGADNHNDGEGSYEDRKAAAKQAYYEWMPIRENEGSDPTRHYRSFQIGNLLSLHMLETRLTGRDQQLNYANYFDPATGTFDAARFSADLSDPNRTLLGAEQLQWLQIQLASSNATWQVLGQQVLMGRMMLPAPIAMQTITFAEYAQLAVLAQTNPEALTPEQWAILSQPSIPYNLDAWDGYAYEREVILETARELDKNLIVLAGDTHNAWANNLENLSGEAVGVEFATSSVSSPGLEEYLPGQDPDFIAAGAMQFVEPLKFLNAQHRGFMVVELTPEQANAEWIFVSTVKSKNYNVLEERRTRFVSYPGAGNRTLVPA